MDGDYTVVADVPACPSAFSDSINVKFIPVPAAPTIIPAGPTTFCAGGSVTLNSSNATGHRWLLNGVGLDSAIGQPTFVATVPGSYTLTENAVGCDNGPTNWCTDCNSAPSAAVIISVIPKPNATITAAASTPFGSTGNTASVANAGAGATYAWSVTGGVLNGGNNTPSITYTAGGAGTLTVHVTVTSTNGCSDAKSANVSVTAPPVTVTSVAPAGGGIAGGSAVTINGTGFAAGASVTLGGAAATNVVVVSSIKLTARTPPHTLGAVNVSVTNTNASTGTLTSGYTYQVFDPNGDSTSDPADIFFLINYLFTGGAPPHGSGGMLSGDTNGDGVVDPADIFYLINYLFLGGQKPNRPESTANDPHATAASRSPEIAGSIALGKPVLRGGHYFVPVVMISRGSAAPQSMSLKLHFDGEIGEVIVRRASAAKDIPTVFETSRRSDNDVSYLVAYFPRGLPFDESRPAVVAEIEIGGAGADLSISIDPLLTMLSNQDGTIKATVANGKLEVRGTGAAGDSSPRPRTPRHEVN